MNDSLLTLYCPLMLLIAINSGLLGSFVLWKKFSNMSESISHFSVLGAAISFVFSLNLNLMIFCASSVYIFMLYLLRRRFSSDTLVALFANTGLALALILSTIFSKVKIDFMSLLFGDILIANESDLIVMLITTFLILSTTFFYWNKIILTIISSDLAKSKSINTNIVDFFIIIAIVAYITIAVKVVGAILLSSMLVIPAASASLISRTPKIMVSLSIIISLLSQSIGIFLSFLYDIPTSGSIALSGFAIFCIISTATQIPRINKYKLH